MAQNPHDDPHHQASEHRHGTMDTSAHRKTFAGFIRAAIWVCVLSTVALIFLALTNV